MTDAATGDSLVSVEAEQSVIGALLLDNSAWFRVTARLTAADFADETHKHIYSAIGRLVEASSAADPITVLEALRADGRADECGGLAYLNALAQAVPSAAAAELYAETVLDRSIRRRARRHGIDLRGATIDDALAKAETALSTLRLSTAAPPPLFSLVPIDDLAHVEPPAPDLWWGEWVPAGVVTLFSAHGGTGKSTVALMLAVSIAAGRPLFGIPTRLGRVAYYSAEDPGEVVRHRLAKIIRGLGIAAEDIEDRLQILDATSQDPALFHEVTRSGGVKSGHTTRAYDDLCRHVDTHQIDVLIVDNASDAFDANEIDRARVRGFMRALTSIAKERGGAVILLAHVDKGTSRGDRGPNSESYSGSTAWHNSARSRWFMSRDKDGILTLEHQKHNLTRQADSLRLMWPEGQIPQLEYVPNGMVQGIKDRVDLRALLKLIQATYSRKEWIATETRSRYHAFNVLKDEPGFPKLKQADLFQLLRRAEVNGLIERETYRDRYRREAERWRLTPTGIEKAGLQAGAASAASIDVAAPAHPSAASAASAAAGGVGDVVRAIGAVL